MGNAEYMGIHKRKNKSKMFTFTHENMEPLFNQDFSELANASNNKNGYCSTSQKSSKWCSCMNLSSLPTKADDLHVKVDEKSRTLTVSGKSETESTRRDGVKIFSTHVWTRETRIPDDVELKTVASKLTRTSSRSLLNAFRRKKTNIKRFQLNSSTHQI